MKTDLERFVELYRSFGIECVANNDGNDGFRIGLHVDNDAYRSYTLSDKLVGHTERHTIVDFNKDGKFIHQAIYDFHV